MLHTYVVHSICKVFEVAKALNARIKQVKVKNHKMLRENVVCKNVFSEGEIN
jgi:hypothetical protein